MVVASLVGNVSSSTHQSCGKNVVYKQVTTATFRSPPYHHDTAIILCVRHQTLILHTITFDPNCTTLAKKLYTTAKQQ